MGKSFSRINRRQAMDAPPRSRGQRWVTLPAHGNDPTQEGFPASSREPLFYFKAD